MTSFAAYVCLWLLVALLDFGGAKNVSNNSQLAGVDASTQGSTFPTTIETQTSYIAPSHNRLRRASPSCLAPPQPANGEYKLDFCDDTAECEISKDAMLKPGSKLVYGCNSGYRATGNTNVYCSTIGEWSPIPECVEVRCGSLSSESTTVSCTRSGKWVNCDSAIRPGTRAEVACRHGYKKDTDFVSTRRSVVNCNTNGEWEPRPIRCVPVCGRTITQQSPLVYGGSPAKIGDFPWHTSLFVEDRSPMGNRKRFICGGTIIKTNLVLTAAHCVYDETTKTTEDPSKLFVVTGNVFRDYDSPAHNPAIVRKASVKNVYPSCNYYGLTGNYVSDIALLELQQPFEFSSILLPACLDDSGFSDQSLEPGVYGKVAGFGRTETGVTSGILQTLTLPYISYSDCKASNDTNQNEAFISSDKFCAGYSNGSAVCEGDSGGGLVFKKGDLWYVMGIVSVGLGVNLDNGEKTCDKYSYSLYTKVSVYMSWIQDVFFYVEHHQPYPSCNPNSQSSTPNIDTAVATSDEAVSYCPAPPQPANGEWRLNGYSCLASTQCSISQGTAFKLDSQLFYNCAPEFVIDGPTAVYCEYDGKWSPIPICISAFCNLTNGSSGVCTLLDKCQPLIEEMKVDKSPDVCGTYGELVCCPKTTPLVEITTPAADRTELPLGGRGAIARQKCIEYSQYASPSRCPWSILDDEELKDDSPTGRKSPKSMEFPHLAAIGFPLSHDADVVSWDCSGALISEIFVLTSAACCDPHPLMGNAIKVRIGQLDKNAHEERRIAERIKHPEYKPPSEYNDIGLIRLENPISLDDWLRPACLHTAPVVENRVAVTTKWGYTDPDWDHGSTLLFKVIMPLVDMRICKARWATVMRDSAAKRITGSAVVRPSVSQKQLAKGINEDWFICAGATGKRTCYGDPGSTLVIHRAGKGNELCMYDVIGVLSLVKNCGDRIPALYTRIYDYIPWIESIVWGQ